MKSKEKWKNGKKYFVKVILTLALLIASYFCFTSKKKLIIQREIQLTENIKKISSEEEDGLKKLLEYIGLFLLVIAAWQWRKEVGFDSFGFMSKQPDVKPTDPENRENNEGDVAPKNHTAIPLNLRFTPSKSTEFANFRFNEILNKILHFMNENPNSITNVSVIANKFGLSRNTAERYLFELMKNKLIRKDTYPGSRGSIYSLTNSIDNKAIDLFIIRELDRTQIISDYRYIRLKLKYEIDALIKSTNLNYLIELKYMTKYSTNIIESGIKQLLRIEELIDVEPLILILLLLGPKDELNKCKIHDFEIKSNMKVIKIDKKEIE